LGPKAYRISQNLALSPVRARSQPPAAGALMALLNAHCEGGPPVGYSYWQALAVTARRWPRSIRLSSMRPGAGCLEPLAAVEANGRAVQEIVFDDLLCQHGKFVGLTHALRVQHERTEGFLGLFITH
jgi:hypothetical protein